MQEYEEDEKADTRHRKSSDTVSLTDCLQLFTEPETLSQEEAWSVVGERERGREEIEEKGT